MASESDPRRFLIETRSLTIAALVVAAGFLGSRLLGLLRSVIIADTFGTGAELDAYWVAFRLPDLVFQLLAGATLASAFIPVFAKTRIEQGEAAAWRLASSVLNLVLLATIAFAVVAFLLAPNLIPWLAPGLGEATGEQERLHSLAVDLTRLMLLSPILFAVSGMFMGILNARRHFLMPALAPIFYNLSIIVAALISDDVNILAAGVVAGAALHLAIQLPDLRSAGMLYYLAADWADTAVRRVGVLMAPRVLGLAASQISFFFVSIFFASRLDSGAISAVSFAWLIVMTPLAIVGMAISTAAFPTLADQAARGDRDFGQTVSQALRVILFLSLPISVGLVILARPLVAVLLQRGAFDAQSAALTAQALGFYGFALFAHSGIEILSRGFYALGDTKTPVAMAIASMLINLALAALLVDSLEVRGLGLALSLATLAEFAALLLVLSRRVPGLADRAFVLGIGKIAFASLLVASALGLNWLLLDRLIGLETVAWSDSLLILLSGGMLGGLIYFLATLGLGCPEIRPVLDRIPWRRRLQPSDSAAP